MDYPLYEMLEHQLPQDCRIGESMPTPEFVTQHPWNACNARTSRNIYLAAFKEVVELWTLPLPALANVLGPKCAKYQLIDEAINGMKLFQEINTLKLLLFRPVPIFLVEMYGTTVFNLPGSPFEVLANVLEQHTNLYHSEICVKIPEFSTVGQAWNLFREAAINATDYYKTSANKKHILCIVARFKHVKAHHRALPIILQQKSQVMKKPSTQKSQVMKKPSTQKRVVREPMNKLLKRGPVIAATKK
jgi:hypothetical protein